MNLIKGQQGMIFRGVTRRYVPGQGDSTVFVYESGSLTEAENFYSSQRAVGSNAVEISAAGPPWTVEIATPDAGTNDPDNYEDQWELPPVEVTKSIWESPAYMAQNNAVKELLRAYDRDPSGGTSDYFTTLQDIQGNGGGATAEAILDLITNDQKEYQAPTVGLRWTRITNRNSAISQAYNSVNRIFSQATIVNLAGIPANIAAGVSAAQANLPNPLANFATGWLKKQATVTYRGAGRVEITQEWILENWSTTLYGSTV